MRHCFCHCGTASVIAGLTRNPVTAWHWIPDQVRDDKWLASDDKLLARDDKLLAPDDKLLAPDDKLLAPDDKWLAAKALARQCQRDPEPCHRIDQQHQQVLCRVLRPLVHEQGAHQIDRVGQGQPL